jgi:ElaB/YqjD/DUF883 family membrane-anchored ribosome-binding protein
MTTTSGTAGTSGTTEGIKERLRPALRSVDENVRHTRRAFIKSRHAAEDLADETVLHVRRRPLSAVALTLAVGTFAGGLLGFALGRLVHGGTTA